MIARNRFRLLIQRRIVIWKIRCRSIWRGFCLMHDDALSHTAHYTQQFLRNHGIITLLHRSSSPDLNPIVHVWDMLERKIREKYADSSLVRALTRTWQCHCINKWNRLHAVILNREGKRVIWRQRRYAASYAQLHYRGYLRELASCARSRLS